MAGRARRVASPSGRMVKKSQAPWKGAQGGKPQVASSPATTVIKGSVSNKTNNDVFYAGIVSRQQKFQPFKFFITCEAMNNQFDREACFLPDQKPANVDVGSLVAFSIAPGAQVGSSPQVGMLVELAPLGEAVLQAAQGQDNSSKPKPAITGGKILPMKRTADGRGK
mmetsp:Transcript_70007/g.122609  ORF Transcript_70007/g.122609 Transcript_70007/m.122609 type:complete len:167 (+) Transcript_70007:48-548(+)